VALVTAASGAPLSGQGGDPCQFDAVCRMLTQNIGIKEPVTIAQLRRFAKLDGDTRSAVKNLHVAGQTDTVHELHYAGLVIRAYAPSTGPALMLEIIVTSAKYPLPLKLAFGKSTFEDVQHALGSAKDIQHLPDGSSKWRYENVEQTASITFDFEPEPSMKIKRVQWKFSID
jgi:hypothetical protein